ncbi:MAG TPA: GDSL-type esterase/lipase family protein [Xanthomonadaceae bacterium]|nr:GDSL-type esterase/lipase family protein [Xanthomonadaceae bacterium]
MHSFLALGDSYTIGEAVRETDRWPVQLAARLRERGIAIDAPRIIATTGWTTDELSAAMDDTTFAPPYALVTLMIGVNNQFRGRDLSEYHQQFDALLMRAIHLAGADATRVIVLSIPDWGATPFGQGSGRDPAQVSAQIDAFNAAAHAATTARGAAWIDVTPVSREVAHDPSLAAHDGLHPSAAMYARWVELVLPVAEARLRKDTASTH